MPRLLRDRIGLRVHVQLLDGTTAEGVIIKRKRWRWTNPAGDRASGRIASRMPTIRLDDGRIVRGCECWWGAATPDPVGYWSIRPTDRWDW